MEMQNGNYWRRRSYKDRLEKLEDSFTGTAEYILRDNKPTRQKTIRISDEFLEMIDKRRLIKDRNITE